MEDIVLPGMTGRANDMATAWQNNPSYWHPISLSEAQGYANNVFFVVAGFISPSGSGHVVVVVLGEMQRSGSYDCEVPCIMDTGYKNRKSSIPLSHGFGSSKKDKIKFYYYK